MVITTLLLFVVMRHRFRWNTSFVFSLSAVFLAVDLTFFGANITKVVAGGWFPLVIGVIGFTLMTTWNTGRSLVRNRMRSSGLPIGQFIESIVEHPQQRVSGTGVYLFAQSGVTPPTLLTNLRHHEVLHERIVIVSVQVAGRPRVPAVARATVANLGEGFFQVDLQYGFIDEPNVPAALAAIVSSEFGFDPLLATYFVGKETVLATEVPGMWLWREHIFSFMYRNAANAARFFGLPPGQVVEVGIQIAI